MRSCFLAVDKPAGITSHDVVAMLRAVTGAKKVGHTGTLDPFATGVLALAFGNATRLISYLDEDLKVYDATISLGSATDTGDPTGQVVREAPVDRSYVTAAVSLWYRNTLSIGTPISPAAICARTVDEPWPISEAPCLGFYIFFSSSGAMTGPNR